MHPLVSRSFIIVHEQPAALLYVCLLFIVAGAVLYMQCAAPASQRRRRCYVGSHNFHLLISRHQLSPHPSRAFISARDALMLPNKTTTHVLGKDSA